MKEQMQAGAEQGLRFALGMAVLAALMLLIGLIGAWLDGGM